MPLLRTRHKPQRFAECTGENLNQYPCMVIPYDLQYSHLRLILQIVDNLVTGIRAALVLVDRNRDSQKAQQFVCLPVTFLGQLKIFSSLSSLVGGRAAVLTIPHNVRTHGPLRLCRLRLIGDTEDLDATNNGIFLGLT